MEPEAVSADGIAIEGYLVRPGRPEALSLRQSRGGIRQNAGKCRIWRQNRSWL
ncbi:MAG: hypothetical protein ACLT8E_12415 [Akkermansia sp.]